MRWKFIIYAEKYNHEEENVFPHFDMPAKGQIRHEQPPAGALGALDGEALCRGVLPQLIGGLLQTGKAQGFLQLCQLRRAVDVDEVVLIPEPVDMHGVSSL